MTELVMKANVEGRDGSSGATQSTVEPSGGMTIAAHEEEHGYFE
jgi:hypothetical protein